jgi:hypothetical protein
MTCELCGRKVEGDVVVRSEELPDGTWVVSMQSTPDRDWICCDSCNLLVCHECCAYPESGYCDGCIKKYKLYDYLVEVGLINSRTQETR